MKEPQKRDKSGRLTEINTKTRAVRIDQVKTYGSEAVERLVQELAIYQAELEAQNEELRTTQVQMEIERRKYSDLFMSAPIGYATLDQRGMIVDINRVALEMLDLPKNIVIGKPLASFVGASQIAAYRDCLSSIDDPDAVRTCELQIRRRDGSMLPAQLSIKNMPAEISESSAHFRVAIVDDTFRKAAQEHERDLTSHLNRLMAELIEANRVMESVGSSLARDIEEEHQSVRKSVQQIREAPADSVEEPLNELEGAIKRADALVASLRILTRLGESAFIATDCDLTSIGRKFTDELAKSEPDRRVDVVIAENLRATGDRRLIEMVLSNLLSNAWKCTRSSKNARIVVDKLPRPGRQTFFVQDNGIGFNMKDASRLFQPFQRLHPEHDSPVGGIGLVLVARAVRRHGGAAWAEGEPDKGATFYFTLGG